MFTLSEQISGGKKLGVLAEVIATDVLSPLSVLDTAFEALELCEVIIESGTEQIGAK